MIYFFFRGGKYSEDDAKAVMVQILNVVAFCHLQGVVHRDLKPEVSKFLHISFIIIDASESSIVFTLNYKSLSLHHYMNNYTF